MPRAAFRSASINTRIHCVQTGSVRIKVAQQRREAGGLARVLLGRNWTEWLPIYAWVLEHAEGLIVVDTGETARASKSSYFPRWQPYYRLAVRMDVSAEQEIGPQMRQLGLDPDGDCRVVLTHLHTDHAGGLHHFPLARFLVSSAEYQNARGLSGRLRGYLPHRWPAWFLPESLAFRPTPFGPFEESYPVTEAGDVVIVPTPGHTPNHVSVVVKIAGLLYFLAGDTSYSEELLVAKQPDGVSPSPESARRTMDKILRLAASEPTVYLPSHDPNAAKRLRLRQTLVAEA